MPIVFTDEQISNEVYLYNIFYRKLIFRRLSQLNTLRDISELTELPKGSILHLINDNFLMNKPIVFVPDVDNFPLSLPPIKKFMHHVTEPPKPNLIKYDELFRLPVTGLPITLINFRKRNQRNMRFVTSVYKFPKENRPNVQSIISYNALYRARIFGMMRNYRRFNYIWTAILNEISLMPNRMHFIPIPVGNAQYGRDKFIASFDKYNKSTIKKETDSWYLFMMNFLGFVNSKNTPSLFEKIPQSLWDKIHFIFYAGSKMFITNLKMLKEFNGKTNLILLRLIKLLNMLAETGYKEATTDFGEIEPNYDTIEDKTELYIKDDEDFDDAEDPITNQKEPEEENVVEEPKIDNIVRGFTPSPVISTTKVKDDNKEEIKQEEPKEEPKQETNKEDQPIKPAVDPKETQKKVDELNNEYEMISAKTVTIDPKWLSVSNGDSNSPDFKEPATQEEQKQFNKDYIAEIDDKATDKIVTDDTITAAQERRAKQMAVAYKNIEMNGKTLEQIINEIPTNDVSTNEIECLKNDMDVIDKSMLKSSVQTFDNDYMKSMFDRDMIMSLVSFNRQGMFLKGIEKKDISDSLNSKERITCKYEDVHHKEHTITFNIPKINENGYCYINGSYKVLKKQRISVPICKVSSTRVTLNSDYNKYLVERNTSVAHSFVDYIGRILEKAKDKSSFSLESSSYTNQLLPYEYTSLAFKYKAITVNGKTNYNLFFKFNDRLNWLKEQNKYNEEFVNKVIEQESKLKGVLIGTIGNNAGFLISSLDGSTYVCGFNGNARQTTLIDLLCESLDVELNVLAERTDFKLLNKTVPTIFALCYRYGLSYMLNYTKVNYRLEDRKSRYEHSPSDLVIKFEDKVLIIPRYPFTQYLLFGGLSWSDLSHTPIDAMDDKDIYFNILHDKKISTNNLKGIDNYFDLFVDPITKDVLSQMKEPTDAKDLLIRATELLTTEDHKPSAANCNYRYRSYERINSAIYKTLSRAYATYSNKSVGATHKWSIADYEIEKLITEDQLLENVDVINPINDIKYQSEYGHGGIGGRASADTFMIDDRQFPEDAIGIMSEATVDCSKTAYAAAMTSDPTIINLRGMCVTKPTSELEPAQVLSCTSILVPCTTNDDGKRCNFVNIHLSHYVATEKMDVSRVRSGYEKIVAHRTRPPFAYIAEDNGTIKSIDTNAKIIKVDYKDHMTAIKYGEEYTNNGGGGFYCTQSAVINNFKVGDKVKKGDVIVYNDNFFTSDPYTKQVIWNMGRLSKVLLLDCDATLDDSCKISDRLAKDLSIKPVHIRDIVLNKATTVHKYAAVGTTVDCIDPLLIFDQSAITDDMFGSADDATMNMLNKLNKRMPKAKVTGTVVKIDAFYKCPLETIAPSIRGIINLVNKEKLARNAAASGARNQDSFPDKVSIKLTDRIGTTDLDNDTIILRFYIQQNQTMHSGDKVELCTSLKSVCTGIQPNGWELDNGDKVDMLFSSIGICNRIILSPLIIGVATRVLETAEQHILDMYFKK